jgi:hypothetical protein
MTAQEVSVPTEQAHAVVDQFAKGAVELGSRTRDGQSAYSVCQPATITLVRGVPIVGGVRFDMQRHRQRHRRMRRVDHHPGDDRERLFDFAVRCFED